MPDDTILLTGAAGFIGFHLATRLLKDGRRVVGVDNLNPYYDVRLKQARLDQLTPQKNFSFELIDIADRDAMKALFARHPIRRVVHLAAQAGVRYSLENPFAYIDANLSGFASILEGCRHAKVEHLVYASSSSVYGGNTKVPFSIHDNVDHPVSLYAATKKANELMAHSYSHLFGLPSTGLRFFTVYGPWGRPDMALFLFTKAILEGRPIDVFNNGEMQRDFTYVDDIVDGIVRVLDRAPAANPNFDKNNPDSATSWAPARVYNIGNNRSVRLLDFIAVLEKAIGKPAQKRMLPLQAGDVPATFADIEDLRRDTGFEPKTPIEEGVPKFVKWYREFYGSP
jgi:UDP-glucuronate 4-epimerase